MCKFGTSVSASVQVCWCFFGSQQKHTGERNTGLSPQRGFIYIYFSSCWKRWGQPSLSLRWEQQKVIEQLWWMTTRSSSSIMPTAKYEHADYFSAVEERGSHMGISLTEVCVPECVCRNFATATQNKTSWKHFLSYLTVRYMNYFPPVGVSHGTYIYCKTYLSEPKNVYLSGVK